MTNLRANLEAALAYAERGWHVFPVKPSGKEPLSIRDVNVRGHLGATTDPDLIRRMWRDNILANVGIATGPSGLVVIDIDMNPWKGKVGGESWLHLLTQWYPDEPGEVPPAEIDTYATRTWSGGRHLFFEDPDGEVSNSTSKLGPDIDTRGNGGYVVAAPSRVVEDGHTGFYEVLRDIPLLRRPQRLVDALKKPERAARVIGAPIAAQDRVLRRLAVLAAELRDAPEGTGNHTASRLAFHAGQYYGAGQVDREDVLRILLDAISGWSWRDERDYHRMVKTIEKGVDDGFHNPRAWEDPVSQTPVTIPIVADPLEVRESIPAVPDPIEEAEAEADSEKGLSMWATDVGQGRFLRSRVGDILYTVGVGWMLWDGMRWKGVDEKFVTNRVSNFYTDQFERTLARWSQAPGEKKWEEIAKAYRSFMGTGRLGAILKALSATDGVLAEASALDAHPDLLNTPSGVVDLRTGELRPHDRKLLMTKVTRAKFVPGATHSDWEMAKTALSPEVAAYLQLRFGQALFGRIPPSDDAVFLMGGGSNGKTSWSSEGLMQAFGDYAALMQAGLIGKQTGGSGPTPERVALRGLRLAVIEELPEGSAIAVAELKRVVGMGEMVGRDLHEKEMRWVASHTLVVSTNYTPVVAEVDEGSWRRLCRVVFPFRFRADPEGPMDRLGDPGLRERLKEGRTGQHEAMLAWMVDGARKYHADPRQIMEDRRPDEIRDATLEWRKEADRILAFFDDLLVVDPDGVVARQDLFWSFSNYLKNSNHAPWTETTFFNRFKSHQRLVSAGVKEGQTRAVAGLSRPLPDDVMFHSGMPQIKGAPRVYRGIRFRTIHDEVTES